MMVGLIIFFVMQMYLVKNRISDIMANMLASSSVDLDSSPGLVKSYTLKLVFVASSLSMQYYGVRTKTGWLGIRIMCPSGATCQHRLFQWASTIKIWPDSVCWSRTKQILSSHQNVTCSYYDMAVILIICTKQ